MDTNVSIQPNEPRDTGDDTEAQHRALRSIGLTLMGIVLSISVSVGFGLSGPWWMRVGVSIATAVMLVVVIKLSTNEGARGPVTRAADWITGEPNPPDERAS